MLSCSLRDISEQHIFLKILQVKKDFFYDYTPGVQFPINHILCGSDGNKRDEAGKDIRKLSLPTRTNQFSVMAQVRLGLMGKQRTVRLVREIPSTARSFPHGWPGTLSVLLALLLHFLPGSLMDLGFISSPSCLSTSPKELPASESHSSDLNST